MATSNESGSGSGSTYMTLAEVSTKISNFFNRVYELGFSEGDVYPYCFNAQLLTEILESICKVGDDAWIYIATFKGRSGFTYDNSEIMTRITDEYYTRETAGCHSGSSFGFMMRLVQSIARDGFDVFAENMIQKFQSNITILNDTTKYITQEKYIQNTGGNSS
jgi:hypothetical protein